MARTLGQMLLLFSSEHDGEVLAAVSAIKRTLAANGKTLHDLAKLIDSGPQTIFVQARLTETWDKIRFLIEHDAVLSEWEHQFVRGLKGRRRISPKQIAVIDRLVERLVDHQ